jgi:hypothetical protein
MNAQSCEVQSPANTVTPQPFTSTPSGPSSSSTTIVDQYDGFSFVIDSVSRGKEELDEDEEWKMGYCFMLGNEDQKWILDSGATHHIAVCPDGMHSLKPCKIRILTG